MKKIIILLSIPIFSLLACQSDKKRDVAAVEDNLSSDTSQKQQDNQISTFKSTRPSSQDIAKRLLGVWIVKDSETGNANFLLRDSVIYYPETDAAYPYKINEDTIVIKYDDYIQHLAFRLQGKDTLILVGEDGTNTFYRVKSSVP